MGDTDGLLTNARAAKNIPVYTDKSLIIAGKSVAEIEGAIFEFEEWSKRSGAFRTFFRHLSSAELEAQLREFFDSASPASLVCESDGRCPGGCGDGSCECVVVNGVKVKVGDGNVGVSGVAAGGAESKCLVMYSSAPHRDHESDAPPSAPAHGATSDAVNPSVSPMVSAYLSLIHI